MLLTKKIGKWYEIIIPKEWNEVTVDGIFREKWQVPKKITHFFRTQKKVHLNGEPANWNVPLSTGTRMQILLFEEEEFSMSPAFIDVEILFEDDHLIVFNKPPFINTHPNSEGDNETLANAAAFYLLAKGEIRNIRHIHRLDRDTSGAILFAKHPLAGALLDKMLENREIKRTYLALVQGILYRKQGTIHEPIGRDRHHATRRRVSPAGQDAITHYKVLKEDPKKQISIIKCWLDTGRTHQIRVHLSHIGHPIAGDVLYGGKPIYKRQALHAAKLEFKHPLTEEVIVCHAPFIDNPPIFRNISVETI